MPGIPASACCGGWYSFDCGACSEPTVVTISGTWGVHRDYANAFHDLSVSADGGATWTKGTAIEYTSPATEAAAATLYIGQDSSAANQWDGQLWWWRLSPFCQDDASGNTLDDGVA